jgi:hypothetical protein
MSKSGFFVASLSKIVESQIIKNTINQREAQLGCEQEQDAFRNGESSLLAKSGLYFD